jgi:hypothetical protein
MKTFAFVILVAAAAAALAQNQQAGSAGAPPPPPSDSAAPGQNGAPPQGTQPQMKLPDKFTNLKILPKTIKKEDLVKTMRTFSQSLGVRCDHCHALTAEKKDFASDAKTEKQVARTMMKMVHKIKTEFFTYKDAPQVSCFMCHHGEHKPTLTPPPQAANFGSPPPPGSTPQGGMAPEAPH